MRQSEAAQDPPDAAAVNVDAVNVGQLGDQFVECDLAPGRDPGFDPAGYARQLAVSAAIALPPRCQRSGITAQLDQLVHELWRHPEVPRSLTMPMTFIDESDNACS